MNFDKELERVLQSDFFFKMGNKEDMEHVVFIKNVEAAFIHPSDEVFGYLYEQINWLPSSPSDEDPF